MKILMFFLPFFLFAQQNIDAETLKSWMDEGKKMTILDARSKEHFHRIVIPGAKWVPFDASDGVIEKAVPMKDRLVVIYCWSAQCPASDYLADRMISLGYTQVYEYKEGLQVWIEKGYRTSHY